MSTSKGRIGIFLIRPLPVRGKLWQVLYSLLVTSRTVWCLACDADHQRGSQPSSVQGHLRSIVPIPRDTNHGALSINFTPVHR